ncbi:MAG TPA: HepT-like ribonuclease domain-containing protein [Amaricoccus sp.]|nr:HepT-like ribonuclease domain-containing protein [Amaricoccus sp.]
MPRPRDLSIPIEQMLEAIAGVRSAATDDPPDVVAKDWIRMRAIERGLEIISEASRRLPDHAKAAEPEIHWRRIAGIGNVLRHDYDGIEAAVLLTTVADDLPDLEAALRRMLARL